MVELQYVSSRHRAQALIMAGQVLINEHRVEKPSESYDPTQITIRLKQKDHPYVSRGALKLEGFMHAIQLDVKNFICVDIGASTGGFTDYLLQTGAKKIYTFDCGSNQLHSKLRNDPRVICQENYNVRFLKNSDIHESVDLIVVDVSFISLKLIIPQIIKNIPGPWLLITLVKPQFEAGKREVGKGGIVHNSALQEKILYDMKEFFKSCGLKVLDSQPAVIRGDKGNQEFFIFSQHNQT